MRSLLRLHGARSCLSIPSVGNMLAQLVDGCTRWASPRQVISSLLQVSVLFSSEKQLSNHLILAVRS